VAPAGQFDTDYMHIHGAYVEGRTRQMTVLTSCQLTQVTGSLSNEQWLMIFTVK
jgi:hypothetical protein